jgi:DNA-binding CsgD family transcriptional regulator
MLLWVERGSRRFGSIEIMVAHASIETAVSALYETVLDPSQWGVAMEALAALFEAQGAWLFNYDFVALEASNFHIHGHDPAATTAYSSYYQRLDPGRVAGMTAQVGEWLADEQLLDASAPSQQEYVRDFAVRFNIGGVAGCKVLGDEYFCQWLSFSRPPGAERFGDASRRTYLTLQPHLRRINRMQTQIDRLSAAQSLATSALDRLRVTVLLVDQSRRVHLVNAHGRRECAGSRGIGMIGDRLACSEPSLNERLGRLILAACKTPAIGGALRAPRGHGLSDWLVTVVPVPLTHKLAGTGSQPLALVFVGDPDADHAPVEIYRSMFSLTTAEATLLVALMEGASVAKWTQQRGVSIATVRTQLHSMFEKAGVDSQSRLVALAKTILPLNTD